MWTACSPRAVSQLLGMQHPVATASPLPDCLCCTYHGLYNCLPTEYNASLPFQTLPALQEQRVDRGCGQYVHQEERSGGKGSSESQGRGQPWCLFLLRWGRGTPSVLSAIGIIITISRACAPSLAWRISCPGWWLSDAWCGCYRLLFRKRNRCI